MSRVADICCFVSESHELLRKYLQLNLAKTYSNIHSRRSRWVTVSTGDVEAGIRGSISFGSKENTLMEKALNGKKF